MNPHLTYLLVDLGCILVPFLFSFHPKLRFHREWKYLWLPGLITALFFLVWDAAFTKAGVWGFNPQYVTGVFIYNLPLEEILFFICIPYSCVFTYHCFKLFFKNPEWKNARVILLISALLFLVAGIIFRNKAYTAFTAFSNAVLLLILAWRNVKQLRIFILSYIAVIPFFLLSNGILTGTGLESPVVWYNNDENLGIRMLTIPFEDLFYGMLLIMMNVAGYEWVKNSKTQKA